MENTEYLALTAYYNAETDKRIESMSLSDLAPYVGTGTGRRRFIDLLTVPDPDGVFVECTPERVNVSVEDLHLAKAPAIGLLVRELRYLGIPVWLTDMDIPEGLLITETQTDDVVESWIKRLRDDR